MGRDRRGGAVCDLDTQAVGLEPGGGAMKEALARLGNDPLAFGLAAGVVNGLLARARGLPLSPFAAVITAAVVGASEALLRPPFSADVAVRSTLGALAGMAPFLGAQSAEN